MFFLLLSLQIGTLRFYGNTMFASGQWAGVELGEDMGKNDGSHGGIRYFSCKPKRGECMNEKSEWKTLCTCVCS